MALPTSTAYIPTATADAYFLTTLKNAEWVALTATEKDASLAEATKWLETLCWKGEACGKTQQFKWPRKIDADDCCPAADCSGLPVKLQHATAELALQLFKNQTSMIGSAVTGPTGAIKRNKLGDLEQEFFSPDVAGSGGGSKYGPNSPKVLQVNPWLGDLLGCYMRATYGSSRIIQRVRS